MKTRTWMYLILVLIWGIIALAALGGSGREVILFEKVVMLELTDTCIDYMTGTVTDGDSGAVIVRVDDADFRGFEGGTGAGQAIWFDTAAWSDTGTFSDNDSNIATSWNPVIFPRANLYGNKGWDSATVDVDSGDNDFTVAMESATNDSEFVLLEALPYDVAGLHATFTFYHDTIKTTLDSAWAAKPDTVSTHDESSHELTGWTYTVWRGGNITDTVWVSPWKEDPNGLLNSFFLRCFSFSNLDSTMAKIVIYTQCVGSDTGRRVPVCSLTTADTTDDLANWTHFPQLADADTAIALGGHLCSRYQAVITVTDSNSLPAAYGTYTSVGFRVVKKTTGE